MALWSIFSLVLLSSLGAGCWRAEHTGFELRVELERPARIDRLEISVDSVNGERLATSSWLPEDGELLQASGAILVRLSPDLDGRLVTVRAEAHLGSEIVADGSADATVAARALIPVALLLLPARECAADEDCGAGLACLSDGRCAAGCVVGGAFSEPGAASPHDPCIGCLPGSSTSEWSPLAEGTPCGPGLSCDGSGSCSPIDPGLVSLTVELGGAGAGRVLSSPTGIDCGHGCDALFPRGSTVVLDAHAEPGSSVAGWWGAPCSGDAERCEVVLDGPKVVAVTFESRKRELTVSVQGSGSVTTVDRSIRCGNAGSSCSATYEHEDTVSLLAAAGQGQRLARWGGACQGSGSACQVRLLEDLEVTATFEPRVHALSLSVDGDGEGEIVSTDGRVACGPTGGVCEASYQHGEVVTLLRSDHDGSEFSGWPAPCDPKAERCLLVMTAGRTVETTFSQRFHELTVEVDGDVGEVISSDGAIRCGAGHAQCSAHYPHGDTVTLESAFSDEAHLFLGWAGACSGFGATCEIELVAEAEAAASFDWRRHSLTVAVDGSGLGRVTTADGLIDCGAAGERCSAAYRHGQLVTLERQAEPGSAFLGWMGECRGRDDACALEMTVDRDVVAPFGLRSYTLEVGVDGDGDAEIASLDGRIRCGGGHHDCRADFDHGASVTLVATPSDGSETGRWIGPCGDTGASECRVSMTHHTEVTLEVWKKRYAVLVTRSGDGNGAVTSASGRIDCGSACEATYLHGEELTLEAAALDDSRLVGWGGVCEGAGATCSLIVEGDLTVDARFELKRPVLTVTRLGAGAGWVDSSPSLINCGQACRVTLDYGQRITLYRSAETGSEFVGWGGGCAGDAPSCAVTVTEDTEVSAEFRVKTYQVRVSVSGDGEGHVVTEDGLIRCGDGHADCLAEYEHGAEIRLSGELFASSEMAWSGDCTHSMSTCELTVTSDVLVGARIDLRTHGLRLEKSGEGEGAVTSVPGGVDCGPECPTAFAYFPHYTQVTLSAAPTENSVFAGWLGDCAVVTDTCTVSVTGARSVTAVFGPPVRTLTVQRFGNGAGTVSSSPAGIDCGPACSSTFDVNTTVELTAVPRPGSLFLGWAGDCTGGGTCLVSMSEDKWVRAWFADSSFQPIGPPYPIVLAHGFFGFEDFAGAGFADYFYHVKDHLASVGEHDVFTPAVDPFNDSTTRGTQLIGHIEDILSQTGHGKVNIIGHSQGGLDARVVAHLRPDLVASVTTFATPHHGSLIADIVLAVTPHPAMRDIVDAIVRLAGAPLWDEMGEETSLALSLRQLSTRGAAAFNETVTDHPEVRYFSLTGRSGMHPGEPHCTPHTTVGFVERFNGDLDPVDPLLLITQQILGAPLNLRANDGLVRVEDSIWGQFLGCVPADHLDEIGHLFGAPPGVLNPWRHKPFYEELVGWIRAQGY